MEIQLLYDNTAYDARCRADWGFSCLVRTEGQAPLLFDTGGDGAILLANLRALDIRPEDMGVIAISHDHWDHTGGLAAVRRHCPDAPVFVPTHFEGSDVIRLDGPREILPGVHLTGELDDIEQALVIEGTDGCTVITGCAHPGLDTIFAAARKIGPVKALVGGFHDWADLEILDHLKLICPCHCTASSRAIHAACRDTCVPGGVGALIRR